MPKKVKGAIPAPPPKYSARMCDYCRNPVENPKDLIVVLTKSFNAGKMVEKKRYGHRKCAIPK